MSVIETVINRRSIRSYQDRPISKQLLDKLLSVAPYYLSGANLQPLKFLAVADKDLCDGIFSSLKWAGYLKEYVIEPHQMPKAYIVLLGDRSICREFEFSAGSAATALTLAAAELGLASCCLGIAKKEKLYQLFNIDINQTEILYVIALGYAGHRSEAVPMVDTVRYRLDENKNFFVPKRRMEDIVQFYPQNQPTKDTE